MKRMCMYYFFILIVFYRRMNVVLDCTYINDDHVDGRGTCGRKLVCYCEKSYTTTNYQPQYNGYGENKNKKNSNLKTAFINELLTVIP